MIVDSCILLDIATNDSRHAEASLAALEHYQGQLAINPLVYAEICQAFIADGVLDRALAGYHIVKLPLPYDAARIAAEAFAQFKINKGKSRHILPDFYIGAHALLDKRPILTRDAKVFSQYFPGVEVIEPLDCNGADR